MKGGYLVQLDTTDEWTHISKEVIVRHLGDNLVQTLIMVEIIVLASVTYKSQKKNQSYEILLFSS